MSCFTNTGFFIMMPFLFYRLLCKYSNQPSLLFRSSLFLQLPLSCLHLTVFFSALICLNFFSLSSHQQVYSFCFCFCPFFFLHAFNHACNPSAAHQIKAHTALLPSPCSLLCLQPNLQSHGITPFLHHSRLFPAFDCYFCPLK